MSGEVQQTADCVFTAWWSSSHREMTSSECVSERKQVRVTRNQLLQRFLFIPKYQFLRSSATKLYTILIVNQLHCTNSNTDPYLGAQPMCICAKTENPLEFSFNICPFFKIHIEHFDSFIRFDPLVLRNCSWHFKTATSRWNALMSANI